MQFQFLPQALSFAVLVSSAFDQAILTNLVMNHSFCVGKSLVTAKIRVRARELKFVEAFVEFFLDADKFGIFAHHRARASLSAKLIEASLMEVAFTLNTFHRFDKNRLAQ